MTGSHFCIKVFFQVLSVPIRTGHVQGRLVHYHHRTIPNIAGLCASALNGFDGAVCAAYLCGKAAELATADIGEYSLTASDVVAYLGKAFLSLRR